MSATRKCHFIGEPHGVLMSERLFLHSQMENYGEHDADSNDNKNYELKRFGILVQCHHCASIYNERLSYLEGARVVGRNSLRILVPVSKNEGRKNEHQKVGGNRPCIPVSRHIKAISDHRATVRPTLRLPYRVQLDPF
ncbi:hypothetical protein RvY_09318 [Ramazzottius varieornatus]|uniref:Uncharacterized protein n=1 Tax=Ramazzottius varieornatus TaxID=947166 RepID=A0A1D1VEG6_RAMVA|nr:hypothetical protein RvY_09318 [Ramazzottius varieornatus]